MEDKPKTYKSFKVSAALFAIVLLCLQFYILIAKDVTALGSDEWNWLPLVRDGFEGEFSFKDYWKAHGGHRVFGYKILLTLNAMFLGLDLRYFQFGGVLLWTLGASVGAFLLNKKLSFGHGFFAIFAALMIITTMISPHAWVNSDYSLIAWRFGNILGFMLIFMFVDRLIYTNNHRKNFLWFSTLLLIYTLIFGRGWGQAMLISTLFFLVIAALTYLKLKDFQKLRWISASIAVGLVVLFIYNLGPEELVAKAKEPISVKGFYNFTTALMGNTLGFDFVGRKNFAIRDTVRLLGVFSISIYAVACFLYLRSSLYKKTVFPLLIMCFSTVAILAAYFGRGLAIGENAAFYPRWIGESCLGLAGALAILFHARHEATNQLNSTPVKSLVNSVLCLTCGFILTTHLIAIKGNIESIKFVHKYDERSLENLFSIPADELNAPKTEAAKKFCKRKIRCRYRPILDEHNLIPGNERYRPDPDVDSTATP